MTSGRASTTALTWPWGARAMLKEFALPGMVAVANPEESGSCRLLSALGFRAGVDTPNGRLFVYEGLR